MLLMYHRMSFRRCSKWKYQSGTKATQSCSCGATDGRWSQYHEYASQRHIHWGGVGKIPRPIHKILQWKQHTGRLIRLLDLAWGKWFNPGAVRWMTILSLPANTDRTRTAAGTVRMICDGESSNKLADMGRRMPAGFVAEYRGRGWIEPFVNKFKENNYVQRNH